MGYDTKYPLLNSITETISNTRENANQRVFKIGLFSIKRLRRINAGNKTKTYLGNDEKLPDKLDRI